MGQKWVKNAFSKSDPGPFGMLKQVVWTHFEPVVPRFGPRKIPKCPEKRAGFNTKNGSKLGEKRNFLKVIMGHLGGSEQCF